MALYVARGEEDFDFLTQGFIRRAGPRFKMRSARSGAFASTSRICCHPFRCREDPVKPQPSRFFNQFGVLRLGLFQDGDIRVRIPPEREESFISSERPDAGSIGIRALRGSRLQGIGASDAQMCQRSRPAVRDNAAVVENLLKLGGGGIALSGCQVAKQSSALWRAIRIGGLSCDQLEPFRTGAFLQCMEPNASRGRMLALHFDPAEREGGL
jgi:hypothetical protein